MKFEILTIFPEVFESYLNTSMMKRAAKKNLVQFRIHDIRKFTRDKHKKVDAKPYGGGAGMVLQAESILRAVESLKLKAKRQNTKVIILSAKGKQFDQKMAYKWSKKNNQIVFISGRYEGIDERVKIVLRAEEISIGPYVLTDGDAAAMVLISAITRLIPGVIRLESLAEESHWSRLLKNEKDNTGKLEYPHYTRPEVLRWKGKKYKVPSVLLSGNHAKIEKWRQKHKKI